MKNLTNETRDSTNEEAKRLVLAGRVTGPAYVIAEEQTAGKGTQGRSWISPKKAGLYFSLIHLPTEKPLPVTTCYTLAAGVACAEALQETTGLTLQLKPVNDLYIEQRKLGGILTETLIHQSHIRALITGIGINLRAVERVIPANEQRGHIPHSLEALLPPYQFERFMPEVLVQEIIEKLERYYQMIHQGQEAEILTIYQRYQLPGTQLPSC